MKQPLLHFSSFSLFHIKFVGMSIAQAAPRQTLFRHASADRVKEGRFTPPELATYDMR